MANNAFDDAIQRNAPQFLVGNYEVLPKHQFRATLHDTIPAQRRLTGKTLPNVPSLSFVSLLSQIGAFANQKINSRHVAWVKTVTYLLSRLDEDDQRDVVQKYKKLPSFTLGARSIRPGFLYTFQYEAEAKQYDKFPLMLAIDRDQSSVLGLNFHYLPLIWRFALFEALMPLVAPLPISQLSRILATYKRLNANAAKYWYWENTIKRYTLNKIKSRVIFISPIEWAAAVAYPSDHFKGITSTTVWKNSITKL